MQFLQNCFVSYTRRSRRYLIYIETIIIVVHGQMSKLKRRKIKWSWLKILNYKLITSYFHFTIHQPQYYFFILAIFFLSKSKWFTNVCRCRLLFYVTFQTVHAYANRMAHDRQVKHDIKIDNNNTFLLWGDFDLVVVVMVWLWIAGMWTEHWTHTIYI